MIVTLAFQHKLEKPYTIRNAFETKVIQLWSWSRYFHSEIIIDGNWISSGPSHGGVYITKLKPLRSEYDYVNIDIDETLVPEVIEWLGTQVGTAYDWTGVFLLGLNSNAHNESKWFCSEICAEVLKRLGVELWMDSNQYTPNELREELTEMHNGKQYEIK